MARSEGVCLLGFMTRVKGPDLWRFCKNECRFALGFCQAELWSVVWLDCCWKYFLVRPLYLT